MGVETVFWGEEGGGLETTKGRARAVPEPVRFEMSDLKELAIEAASKGSAPTAVLAVLLLAGFLVQNPGPEDHRVILETRLVCPSSAELSSPEHVRRRPSQDELEPRTATGLSDYAVFSLSSLLPLMPATGLAKQGYDASLGGPGGNPILSALANGPAFRLSAVHAIGQAGTFLVSQIARFSSTRPGADFYERCGPASVERICKRASDNNLSTVQLVRPLPPPPPTTTTTTTTTTTETTTAAANFSDIFSCPRNKRSGGEMLNETSQIDLNEGELKFFQNFTLDRDTESFFGSSSDEREVLTLCSSKTNRSDFADLFGSLHGHPEFGPGSFAAALVATAFGVYLTVEGKKKAAAFDRAAASSGSAVFWTLLQFSSFAALAIVVFVVLVNFYSQTWRSGNQLLLSLSLGAIAQLLVVVWSIFGKLFFDLRRFCDRNENSEEQRDENRMEMAA